MSERFVAVVGTINHDVILTREGRTESLGGILYNTIPLAILLADTGRTVRAVGRLGERHRGVAREILARFPGADGSRLIADPAGTNETWLDYREPGERVEGVELRVAPLSAEDLAPVEGAEAILVNMISGRDVSVSELRRLRERTRARMYLDVQALARDTEEPREPRIVPDATEWVRAFHVVRGNEVEIAHLGGVPGRTEEAAARILEWGAEEVLVTRGERGAWHFLPGEHRDIAPVPCPEPVDPTGCGDSFLAAYVAGRVRGMSGSAAAELAALVASRVAALSGLEALEELSSLPAEAAARFSGWSAPHDP